VTTRDPITLAAALVLLGFAGCCDCGGLRLPNRLTGGLCAGCWFGAMEGTHAAP